MPTKFFQIDPAIGVARVGSADRSKADFFFIGPEVPGTPANFDTAKKAFLPFKLDSKVRPQAARFRVFEFERADDGKVRLIGETRLNERGVSAINWTVHVANRKASFVQFRGQKGTAAKPPFFSDFKPDKPDDLRNKGVEGVASRREQLDLDPGAKSIAGGSSGKVDLAIASGPLAKLKLIKTLGELRSDPQGRLIFIGGLGKAEAFPKEVKLGTYANNDGWFDDVSDGPVSAEVTVDGVKVAATGAWVMTGPPDFVPAQRSYRTMYDTLADMMARDETSGGPFAVLPAPVQRLRSIWLSRSSPSPVKPSFTADLYPMLKAMSKMNRVHAGDPRDTSSGYHGSFGDDAFAMLGSEKEFDPGMAQMIFSMMRSPDKAGATTHRKMPKVLGHDPYEDQGKNQAYHTVSPLQMHMLELWSKHKAALDWTGSPPADNPQAITPDGLDEAALENTTGGPFYPGIEMGWLTARPEVYAAPLRFALGQTVGEFEVGGSDKTRKVTIEAGAFSQQMALPWHADFMDCRREPKDEDKPDDPPFAAWWPVQRPDETILPGKDTYVAWTRGYEDADDEGQVRRLEMTKKWDTRGFVVQIKGDLFEVEGPPEDVPVA